MSALQVLKRFGIDATTVAAATVPAAFAGFTDPLFDDAYLDSHSGVTFGVNLPTKYASNPIFPSGSHAHTWDEDKLYTSVFKVGSTWHAFYKGMDDAGNLAACYAHSSDGLSWTRPNIGRHTYDGSTNNNLIMDVQARLSDGLYDPVNEKWYVVLERESDATNFGFFIYQADDPEGPYTKAKTVHEGSSTGGTGEARSLVRRADGRWLAYWRQGTIRDIHAALSDTQDVTGGWTDLGLVLEAPSSENQYYGIGAYLVGSVLHANVLRYNATSEQLWIDLYTSRDGIFWKPRKTEWIPVGTAGAWDDEIITTGTTIAIDGDDWHAYYSGAPVGHDASLPRDSRIGRATIPRGRVGQADGTGALTTVELQVSAGATLTVNVDASGGGSLDIEAQDTNGDPISGFAEADFDTITTDEFAAVPTWGGQPMPDDQTLRLKFVLSTATLHGYEVSEVDADPAAFSPAALTGLELWLDFSDESTITDSAGSVTAVTDKSANGHSFEQATAASQPATGASTLNARNVLDFDGDHLTFNGASGAFNFLHDGTEHTIFAVVRAGNSANPDDLYHLLGSNRGSGSNVGVRFGFDDRSSASFDDAGTHQVSKGGGTSPVAYVTDPDFWPADTWGVASLLAKPGDATASERSRMWWNNADERDNPNTATETPSSSDPAFPLDIGSCGDGFFPFVGAIAELVIVSHASTPIERTRVNSYLADRWGIAL